MKNLQTLLLILLLAVTCNAGAQIITSKKEAQKKGLYSYTDKKGEKPEKKPAKAPAAEKQTANEAASVDNAMIAYQPVVKKETARGPKTPAAPAAKAKPKKKTKLTEEPTDPNFTPEPYENYLAVQLANNAIHEFKGVRYRGGGTTKDGMDCSGMVFATFKLFDIILPRSSHAMASIGTEIKLSEVKRGDLLFFKNNRRRNIINHVGIVTEVTPEGEVKFLHSSTSSGVIISSMNEDYHKRTFVQANRVVED